MKRKVAVFLSILLSLSCLTSVACSSKQNDSKKNSVYTNELRDFTVKETNDYLVKAGKTDYVVVIPETSSDTILTAKDEFVELFRKATDITLPVIRDNGLTHSATAKYISIGDTTLLKSAGVKVDKSALTRDGLRVVTKDKSIYLAGGSDSGALNAVYTFMDLNFNFETYWLDCFEIDKGITELKLMDYQVTDVPDFYDRIANYGMYNIKSSDYDESKYKLRMRMNGERNENFLPVFEQPGNSNSTSGASTNADLYLPREAEKYEDNEWGTFKTYYDAYNGYWFSDNGNQFCYTGHGNKDAYNAMIEICAAKICYSLTVYTPVTHPQYSVVTLTQQDNGSVCTCASCNEAKAKYGDANSGSLCVFNNKVMERVVAWMNKPENAAYKRDDLILIFFAYDFTTAPPAIKQADGSFKPAAPEVVLRDDVGIYYANQYFENQLSIYDDLNATQRDNCDGWGVLTNNIYTWLYSANFNYFMYLYDSFDFYNSEGYQYFASKSRRMMVNQTQDATKTTCTAWYNLKAYLDAKLMWNCTQDTNALIDDYFNAMYKDAAKTMKELFLEMRAYNAYILEKYDLYKVRSIYNKPENSSYWSLATLEQWIKKCDKALSEVEHLKAIDYDLYMSTVNHIEVEALSPMYILIQLYGSQLTTAAKNAYLDRMQDVLDRMDAGMMKTMEHGSASVQDWIKDKR